MCAKFTFAISVTLLFLQVENLPPIEPGDRERKYRAFFLQLQILHLYPDCIISFVMYSFMLGWPYEKVMICVKAHEGSRSILAIFLILLGFTCYDCMDLMNSAPHASYLGQFVIIFVYFYIIGQALIGHVYLFIILVHACKALRRSLNCCCSDSTRRF